MMTDTCPFGCVYVHMTFFGGDIGWGHYVFQDGEVPYLCHWYGHVAAESAVSP